VRQIRNFEHLLLTKQLYQDALDSSDRGDRSLLTRALIILDLSIELALKNILINLDPNFAPDQGRRDILWHDLWHKTDAALKQVSGNNLSERSECMRLHEFRNLVQHHGFEPSLSDLRRYLASAERMLFEAFRDAFGLDFHNLRRWDFVENEDIKRLLNECEEFLEDGNPVVCMIGCKWVRDILIDAIRTHGDRIQEGHAPHLSGRTRQEAENLGEFGEFILNWNEYANKRISQLEDELVLIGFGLSTTDTRLFLNALGTTYESMMSDGQIEVQIVRVAVREEAEHESIFMLNYLYRLLRALGESTSDILSSVRVSLPLSEQEIVKYDWFKE
jgi:hypothetical protein